MLGPFRGLLTSMALGGSTLLSIWPRLKIRRQSRFRPIKAARLAPADFALPGEDPPKAFVPARPRTIDEQKRVEALRYFAVARSYEERRQFSKAIESLEKAIEANPDPTPMLRRLARINFALGRDEKAVSFARRVLQTDPGDVDTVELLLRHYRDDPAAAETLLKDVLKNEKLGKNSYGALYVEFQLGNLYEASLQFDKAAQSFAKVVEGSTTGSRAISLPTNFADSWGPTRPRRISGLAACSSRPGRPISPSRHSSAASTTPTNRCSCSCCRKPISKTARPPRPSPSSSDTSLDSPGAERPSTSSPRP